MTLPGSAAMSPSGRAADGATAAGISVVAEPEAPMFVLPLGGLSAARGFPTYAVASRSGVLVPCDSLDRSRSFVVFVSHRWVADSVDPGGGSGSRRAKHRPGARADVCSTKHALVVEALHSMLPSLPRWVGVYVWMDYSCIDQVRSKPCALHSVEPPGRLEDLSFARKLVLRWRRMACRNTHGDTGGYSSFETRYC